MRDGDRDLDGLFGRALHALSPASRTAASDDDRPGAGAAGAPEDAVVARADRALARGLELKRWWEGVAPERRFAERFDLGRTFNEPTESFGFFDEVPLDGEAVPVMGNFQEMFYDRPKSPAGDRREAAEWTRAQLRRFVLRYFMRISDFREPEGFTDTWRPPLSTALSTLSWCPQEVEKLRGFGFRQLWFKERGAAGRVRRFPDEEAYAIVDLEELGERYEWILVQVRIFDFRVTLRPFGSGGPTLSVPLEEDSYLVLSADFVDRQERPEPGVLGRYGLGYAFIRDPRTGFLGYGPGRFDAAIELIRFDVFEDGSIRAPLTFVANRPERVAMLDLDPLGWGMELGARFAELASLGLAGRWLDPMRRLANVLPRPRLQLDPVLGYVAAANRASGGLASDALCIDREQLEKDFLVKHYIQHYRTVAGSLATWRRFADWLDEESLPAWVRQGRRP